MLACDYAKKLKNNLALCFGLNPVIVVFNFPCFFGLN